MRAGFNIFDAATSLTPSVSAHSDEFDFKISESLQVNVITGAYMPFLSSTWIVSVIAILSM